MTTKLIYGLLDVRWQNLFIVTLNTLKNIQNIQVMEKKDFYFQIKIQTKTKKKKLIQTMTKIIYYSQF